MAGAFANCFRACGDWGRGSGAAADENPAGIGVTFPQSVLFRADKVIK
jgi:hypothetical protein